MYRHIISDQPLVTNQKQLLEVEFIARTKEDDLIIELRQVLEVDGVDRVTVINFSASNFIEAFPESVHNPDNIKETLIEGDDSNKIELVKLLLANVISIKHEYTKQIYFNAWDLNALINYIKKYSTSLE